MTIDEAEKLATNVVSRDGAFRDNMNELRRIEAISSLLGHGLVAAQNANGLARFVLAVMPVVRAADRWFDSHRPWQSDEAKPLSPSEHPFRDERDLLSAVARLRAMEGK